MKFTADLHVHSKFSRATARNLDLEHLYQTAQLKGIHVVGTGDFTHPQWFAEIKEKLEPAEQGLFQLKADLARACDEDIPPACKSPVRFMLQAEISNIYKKDGRTRKNHNLVYVPDLETAGRLNQRLDKIGNIKSDGRPILGLDARNLLELVLAVSAENYLIPAHVWTPWFSLLGSKSGFDSVSACFEDLSSHIFAIETGLSSDPPMNWRVSALDRLSLVSNSDAHSPAKLGREANLFDTDVSYAAIRSAIESGDPKRFLGTIEFYPEEGKYHLDGHRKCNVRLSPQQTRDHNGKCPVCGGPLTLGVLYRVAQLADRPQGYRPPDTQMFQNLIPITDILSEVLQVGPGTKKVRSALDKLLYRLGPEFKILQDCPIDAIDAVGIPLLGEAVRRMRADKVIASAGYDGEFGRITLFEPKEREKLVKGKFLFVLEPETIVEIEKPKTQASSKTPVQDQLVDGFTFQQLKPERPKAEEAGSLNSAQKTAVDHDTGPLLIVAGPGTGKTLTLTRRIARLIEEKRISPTHMLAITFTNKAAQEMSTRLRVLLKGYKAIPFVGTFHSLAFKLLKEHGQSGAYSIIDEDESLYVIKDAIGAAGSADVALSLKPRRFKDLISLAKQYLIAPKDVNAPEHMARLALDADGALQVQAVYQKYQDLMQLQHLWDFDDLIFNLVTWLDSNPDMARKYRNQFQYIFVDEYQDLNFAQYRLIRLLTRANPAGANICVIGDPDQAIYGFRGADVVFFQKFTEDYPEARIISLSQNYRSTETILQASHQIIGPHSLLDDANRVTSGIRGIEVIKIMELPSDKSEAECVARTIEALIGGTGFHAVDSGRAAGGESAADLTLADFAVLFRTREQGRLLADILQKAGIPCQRVSRETIFSHKGVSELIALFKITQGQGGFSELAMVSRLMNTGLGQKSLEKFKHWCYAHRYDPNKAWFHLKRIPIPDLGQDLQRKLFKWQAALQALDRNLTGMTVKNRLIYLTRHTPLADIMRLEPDSADIIEELIEFSGRFAKSGNDFLAALALQSDTDAYDPSVEKVSLLTMHAAKGLEFPVVFITGCEAELIPYQRNGEDPGDITEERRLFYVAMTRAKYMLYLLHARKRKIHGQIRQRALSPFVADIQAALREHTDPLGRRKKKKISPQVQLELF